MDPALYQEDIHRLRFRLKIGRRKFNTHLNRLKIELNQARYRKDHKKVIDVKNAITMTKKKKAQYLLKIHNEIKARGKRLQAFAGNNIDKTIASTATGAALGAGSKYVKKTARGKWGAGKRALAGAAVGASAALAHSYIRNRREKRKGKRSLKNA